MEGREVREREDTGGEEEGGLYTYLLELDPP
jgi:hypothetical protein